jgi:hypothetical protein
VSQRQYTAVDDESTSKHLCFATMGLTMVVRRRCFDKRNHWMVIAGSRYFCSKRSGANERFVFIFLSQESHVNFWKQNSYATNRWWKHTSLSLSSNSSYIAVIPFRLIAKYIIKRSYAIKLRSVRRGSMFNESLSIVVVFVVTVVVVVFYFCLWY